MGAHPLPAVPKTIESYLAAVESLLGEIIRHGRFELTFVARKETGAEASEGLAYVVNFSGTDQDLLLEKNAALLDALESVVLKAIRIDENLFGKITFDCLDWRRSRVEELKLMARVASERVIDTGDPFSLNPMNARERRIVHLALKDETRVRTQSDGFGSERKVVIVKS